jgi:hypothetical protein
MSKPRDAEKPQPMARPRPERLVEGEVRPERPVDSDAELDGIEIDNAIERPQEGQPGQPGGKPS